MAAKDLTTAEIEMLVGDRHPVVGFEYPPQGLQPYYTWLIQALQRLADASCGEMRVARDAESVTSVHIAPGRASVGSAVLVYAGGRVDLASFNNDVALVYLEDDGAGHAQVTAASTAQGDPAGAHLNLAEVTLETGTITRVVDRRFETILKA